CSSDLSLPPVSSIGNVESCFIDRGEEHVGQWPCGLTSNDFLHNCRIEHCGDHTEPVVRFKSAPLVPSEYCRAVDEQDLLHVGVLSRRGEELLKRRNEQCERVVSFVDNR